MKNVGFSKDYESIGLYTVEWTSLSVASRPN